MRRGLLLLLLRAAADDRVVPRRQDTAVPPWLLRGADPETVRALPLDSGAARRGLQSSSDACGYVSVSGSTGQTSFHGLYQATGTCDSKPSYDCLDCSSSGAKIWHHPFGYWMMGTGGCDSTSANIYIISSEDLEDVSGDWTEAGAGVNSAIESPADDGPGALRLRLRVGLHLSKWQARPVRRDRNLQLRALVRVPRLQQFGSENLVKR